jgi:hypothetical protein
MITDLQILGLISLVVLSAEFVLQGPFAALSWPSLGPQNNLVCARAVPGLRRRVLEGV